MFGKIKSKINISQAILAREKINQAGNILIVTHRNPDGDAIGSVTAMIEYLRGLDKEYIAFCFDGVPISLEYLKYSYEIISDKDQLKTGDFDLIICLDCADIDYSGIKEYLKEMKDKEVELINIDHHPLSDYGSLNINYQFSSTAEILYELFNIWQVGISQEMATSLLAGILVDTSNFSNSATGKETLTMAAELVKLGGRYGQVNKRLYENKDERGLRLWSKVLRRLQKNDKLKVAYSVVLGEDIEGDEIESIDGVANFFSYLDEVRMAMVLRETARGEIKVSLRALDDKLDVADLARVFGGGGHVKAAGFSIKGRLEREGNYWKII
jgi:phosphoesterase RecJ-like protein